MIAHRMVRIMGNFRNRTWLLCTFLICQICSCYIKNGYSNVSCIGPERRALMEFKGNLVDPANRLASWIGEDCCYLDGITCNHRSGHVEKIDLRNIQHSKSDGYHCLNCLGGEINASLLNLDHLNYLDLSSNNFSEIQIPTFCGSLKNMRYLSLSGAGFHGDIPPHLGNLSNLQYLDLGSTVPIYLADYTLTAENLKCITGLTSLKSLDLSTTKLYESADWLNSVNMLPSLSSLKLQGCGLVGQISTPPHVNLTSLVSLDLSINLLSSNLPLWLFNLSCLDVLRLDNNHIQGLIPSMLEKLTFLTVFDLSHNFFNSSSFLHSVCNHSSLISLNLEDNQLEGALPLCLGSLISLRVLNLGHNKLGGKIPSKLGHLEELSELHLHSNSFDCSIPSSFGRRTKLKSFDLSNNQLNGVLSESLFVNIKGLKLLKISENYFLTFNLSSQWIPPFQLQEIRMASIFIGTQFPTWLQTQKEC